LKEDKREKEGSRDRISTALFLLPGIVKRERRKSRKKKREKRTAFPKSAIMSILLSILNLSVIPGKKGKTGGKKASTPPFFFSCWCRTRHGKKSAKKKKGAMQTASLLSHSFSLLLWQPLGERKEPAPKGKKKRARIVNSRPLRRSANQRKEGGLQKEKKKEKKREHESARNQRRRRGFTLPADHQGKEKKKENAGRKGGEKGEITMR